MKKIQFGFDQKSWKGLCELKRDYRSNTLAETLRDLISIGVFLNKKIKDGYCLKLHQGNEITEVVAPFLPSCPSRKTG